MIIVNLFLIVAALAMIGLTIRLITDFCDWITEKRMSKKDAEAERNKVQYMTLDLVKQINDRLELETYGRGH